MSPAEFRAACSAVRSIARRRTRARGITDEDHLKSCADAARVYDWRVIDALRPRHDRMSYDLPRRRQIFARVGWWR